MNDFGSCVWIKDTLLSDILTYKYLAYKKKMMPNNPIRKDRMKIKSMLAVAVLVLSDFSVQKCSKRFLALFTVRELGSIPCVKGLLRIMTCKGC